MLQVVNFWNKTYINLTAPTIKVFKLCKFKTEIDSLYVESKNRIYLSPFDIRSFHLDLYWQQMLGTFALEEQEETMQFVCNFEDMVQRIRKLKSGHISDMYITYSGSGIPSILKNGNSLIIKLNGIVFANYNLDNHDYSTIKKIATAINTLDYWSVTLQGKNDLSTSLTDFHETSFKSQTLNIFSKDAMFDNTTDVIEAGDAILTNKWRLYEVRNAQPFGNFVWDYVTWKMECGLARIDQMSLPADYAEEIKKRQYGIKERIDIE